MTPSWSCAAANHGSAAGLQMQCCCTKLCLNALPGLCPYLSSCSSKLVCMVRKDYQSFRCRVWAFGLLRHQTAHSKRQPHSHFPLSSLAVSCDLCWVVADLSCATKGAASVRNHPVSSGTKPSTASSADPAQHGVLDMPGWGPRESVAPSERLPLSECFPLAGTCSNRAHRDIPSATLEA